MSTAYSSVWGETKLSCGTRQPNLSQRNMAGGGERSQELDSGGKAVEGSSGSEQVSTAGLTNLWEYADSQACGFTMSFGCSHQSHFQEINGFAPTSFQ